MLEKPALADQKIVDCLQREYGLTILQVAFLPLGADFNTAVFHLLTQDQTPYFLKLRSGPFNETAVSLPKFLNDQGIQQIIPPLPIMSGQLWGNLDQYKTILYPFVDGRDGYEVAMSEAHWLEFGAALKKIHTAIVPSHIRSQIRRENYSPQARQFVRQFLAQIEINSYADSVSRNMALFLQNKQAVILDLISRAEQLAQTLQAEPLDLIVCHSDIHAGNLFIGTDNAFYIVDWDEPILAPKERDLMYIGGGLLASGLTPEEEEALFYAGYGQTERNWAATAYYRCERIIQDIYEYCKQLTVTENGGEDLAQSFLYLKSNFLPNHTIDIAIQSDRKGTLN